MGGGEFMFTAHAYVIHIYIIYAHISDVFTRSFVPNHPSLPTVSLFFLLQEFQEGNKNIVIEQADMKQTVYIYK